MKNSILTVIRSLGERTTNLCLQLAASQVPEENIVVINEAPFSQAVRKTFECGIERGMPWTLALDADILLNYNSFDFLVRTAEEEDKNIFEVQGCILDKLFVSPRTGGPHLFRTMYLEKALEPSTKSSFTTVVDTKKLDEYARLAGLNKIRIWSEFMFTPNDNIRIGPDTERWEQIILDLEMKHYDNPHYLGSAMLLLRASKPKGF